jgi:hypothetical protein
MMADLKTLADVQEYRQEMLSCLRKHDWLAYNWRDGSGHERVADQLLAEGLIIEIPDPGKAGRRAFRLGVLPR